MISGIFVILITVDMPYQFVGLFLIFVFTNIYPVAGDGKSDNL